MEGDSLKSFKFNMSRINVDSIVQSSLKALDSLNIYMPKNIHINIDSLLNSRIYHNAVDSQGRINSREYKKVIKISDTKDKPFYVLVRKNMNPLVVDYLPRE